MEERVRTVATALLGAGLMVAGAVKLVPLLESGERGALPYYSAVSLFGGGLMVLAGMLLRGAHPSLGTAILLVGAVTGVAASTETVVLPVLILIVVVLTLRDQTRVRV